MVHTQKGPQMLCPFALAVSLVGEISSHNFVEQKQATAVLEVSTAYFAIVA